MAPHGRSIARSRASFDRAQHASPFVFPPTRLHRHPIPPRNVVPTDAQDFVPDKSFFEWEAPVEWSTIEPAKSCPGMRSIESPTKGSRGTQRIEPAHQELPTSTLPCVATLQPLALPHLPMQQPSPLPHVAAQQPSGLPHFAMQQPSGISDFVDLFIHS